MKLDVQFSEQNENMNVRMGEFWGGGGTTDHTKLTNRDAADQHPIGAITGLSERLYGKTLAKVPVDVETYEAYITPGGKVVKGKTDFVCSEIQAAELPNEFYLESRKSGNIDNGWFTIQGENNVALKVNTDAPSFSGYESEMVIKVALPEGAKRLVVANNKPNIWIERDVDFPEAYNKDGVFWSRVWRYEREESDPEDDEGMCYQTEHTYGLYYWLWKNNVPVKLVGYNGKPDENGSMYGVYNMTGWETSELVSNGKRSGTITFLRLDVKPCTHNSFKTLVHVATQLDLIAVTASNNATINTHKRVYIPEIPATNMYNGANAGKYHGKTVIPAIENGDVTPAPVFSKMLVGGTDFFELDDTYTDSAIKSAVDNSMVFSDKQAIADYQDNAIEILSRANEVKAKNLINPDSPDVKYGWYFYNTATTRLTGRGTALWATTGYIKVKPNTPYFLYGNATPRAFDKDKVFVKKSWTNLYGTSNSTTGRFYTFADGVKYVRFSAKTGVTDSADNETFFRNNFVLS